MYLRYSTYRYTRVQCNQDYSTVCTKYLRLHRGKMTEIKTRTKTAEAFPVRVSTFKALFEGASAFTALF